MPADNGEADAVLSSLRKRRSSPACYPCSKRKVRCKGARPCDACIARGHPEICHEDVNHKRRRQSASKSAQGLTLGHNQASPSANGSAPVPSSSLNAPSEALPISSTEPHHEPAVGKFSAINFVRERLNNATKPSDNDIHASIGLGNSDTRPLVVAPLNAGVDETLSPPTRSEVLRYYPYFRDNVVVLYPFVYNVAALDTEIHGILQDRDTARPQHVAVVLASLALGAQFAETVGRPRREISRSFISRSTAYLQQANYVFQPSLEVVQALLMIGMALQNSGQSDSAWALLGLNYRLGQTIGIHLLEPGDGQGALLWTALIWQDALISLRYDRPPLSYGMGLGDLDQSSGLSYYQALRSCCLIGIDMLQTRSTQRTDMQYVQRSIAALDDMMSRCCTHLQPYDQVRSFEQRLQHYALQLHSSLVLAEICRPVFSLQHDDPVITQVRQTGLNALITNVEAYLEICTFSNVPMRLWSMTQSAVSCALVLALIIQQDSKHALQPLLRKLISALRMATDSHDPITSLPFSSLHGVCLMRVKAAALLESILADISVTAATDDNYQHAAFPEISIDAVDTTWPTELSMFDQEFANSVLTFDMDREIYYDESLQS